MVNLRAKLEQIGLSALIRMFRLVAGQNMWPVVVVGGIIEKDGKILLIRRGDGSGYGLPGGLMESGESLEAGLKREVKEETGLDVEIKELAGICSDPKAFKFHRILVLYSASISSGKLAKSHEGEPEFHALDNLPKDLLSDHHSLIKKYKEGKSSIF